MVSTTAASPSAALLRATIGRRVRATIWPRESTSPAATFVPPISMPRISGSGLLASAERPWLLAGARGARALRLRVCGSLLGIFVLLGNHFTKRRQSIHGGLFRRSSVLPQCPPSETIIFFPSLSPPKRRSLALPYAAQCADPRRETPPAGQSRR